MAYGVQILLDKLDRLAVNRNVADFTALAVNTKMFHAATIFVISYAKCAKLRAPQRVEKKNRKNGPVALSLECVLRRGL